MNLKSSTPAALETDASHAVGQYLAMGPTRPLGSLIVTGLEGVRSRLNCYPTAINEEVCAWVCIEQAFAVSGNSSSNSRHSTGALFEQAEDSFTRSLDLYDETEDSPDHLWKIELAMGALPLYKAWADQMPADAGKVKAYQEDAIELGHKLIALKEENTWDNDTSRVFNGLSAEVLTLLAYNRRQQSAANNTLSFAVPSTLRQNLSRRAGLSGSRYDRSWRRGNWDISVVGQQAGRWALEHKLQVKSVLPQYGKGSEELQDYVPDVTVVSVRDHICRGQFTSGPWEPLRVMLGAAERDSPRRQKTEAASMSRNLYEHIDFAVQGRASAT